MISTFGRTPNGALLIGDYDSGGLFQFDCSSLPVELVSLQGHAMGDRVIMRWTTLTETGNAGFEMLHRSPGGSLWTVMGFVEGRGTTIEPTDYRFETPALDAGTHTFRLRQIDVDGTTTLGPELQIAITTEQSLTLSAPQPHPVRDRSLVTLTTARSERVTVRLYDVLGRQVGLLFDDVVSAGRPATLDLSAQRLDAGVYFLRAATATTFRTAKVIVQ
jgi:hypothetical protein